MTLTSRLSLFFLGALALVLLGFSATVYLLASTYLYRQIEDRLEMALNSLSAAAELEQGGLEWVPHEHSPALDHDLSEVPICWLVTDGKGNWVDGAKHFFPDQCLTDSPVLLLTGPESKQMVAWHDQPWLISQRRLESKDRTASTSSHQGQPRRLYPALLLQAGTPLGPVQSTLRNLALSLAGISVAIWLCALFGGRWLCRRALLPVARMATAARTMDADDLGQRLPTADTRDELEDLGQAFNDLLARVHEAYERQRRFTGDASHQLRTPLTAILGQLEVALRRARSQQEYQRVLASVQGQAQHLQQIVEMLLFLARADAESKLPHLETVHLADWLREHVHGWSRHDRFPDLRMESAPASCCWVEAHLPLLGQLMDNLLDNACKYSQAGTPIVLRLGQQEGMALLTVEDAGCGIAAEDLPHVFEPFFRSAHARQQGSSGAGLGLAIAERIALAFAGHLAVTSEKGKGSRFTLSLPQVQSPYPLPPC